MKAFPNPMTLDRSGKTVENQVGMDLRDYFAAQAMPVIMKYIQKQLSKDNEFEGYNIDSSVLMMAFDSYRIADAMMEARNGK
jgi:hypothetical protein